AKRYRFGLGITDFLVCNGCGAYVAAVIPDGDGFLATLNVNILDDRDQFDPAPSLFDYSDEAADERISRRRKQWTPTTLLTAS
ncbi:MAG: hypothetical protein AAF439_07405, partial [Pseudomonadota bacterium]